MEKKCVKIDDKTEVMETSELRAVKLDYDESLFFYFMMRTRDFSQEPKKNLFHCEFVFLQLLYLNRN